MDDAHARAGGADSAILNSKNIRTRNTRRPYESYFSVVEHDIQVPRFDGLYSEIVTRAAFICGDCVSVLPYDVARDRVMLIEQFRFGPHVRGDDNPWKLEAIAGRIDDGETPAEAAIRETKEETGLDVQNLLPTTAYYPSPGALTEFLYSYIGLVELPDGTEGIAGLPEEAENIKSHLVSFDDAIALLSTGQVDTGTLVTSLLWLSQHRKSIRNAA
ncbi:MAG: NUDIX domain-containing protein [Paracoccaceae bacterium]